ncbi:MAG: hypothetical protein JW864_07970 [Spirochaetes bacterium]|nr:hypothetical protein [Spirochaetota bacterium]
MRDDLSTLFERLVSFFNDKNNLLEQINRNEIQLRYLVKSGNEEEITGLLQSDSDLFVRLDSLEFDIQTLISNICKITGIEKNRFNSFFSKRDEDIIKKVFVTMEASEKKMYDLFKDRKKVIKEMEEKMTSIHNDINTLKFIRRIKY